MPPEIDPIPLPETMGEDAAQYLELHGLVDQKPYIRSSDYGIIRRCPFTYYLTRRLGLVKGLRYSEALSRGTWVHHRFALITMPPDEAMEAMYRILDERNTELDLYCKDAGVSSEGRREILFREDRDFLVANAWCEAALSIPCIDKKDERVSLGRWLLNNEEWEHVGQELLIKRGDRVVQPDLLLYNKINNKLWVVDFKTCASSPHVRLQTCPWEFQTQHYFHTIRDEAIHGDLFKVLDLPSNTELAGVMHIAIRKPSIHFGMNDRPYSIDTTPLKSGPRKGEPRNTKKFVGDPSPEIYRERCSRWYLGEGEYEHLRAERMTDPAVNISFTPSQVLLAPNMNRMYNQRLDTIRAYRDCPCQPDQYEVGEVTSHTGRLPAYSPFIMMPVHRWKEIMQAEGFTIKNRDEGEIVDGVHASFNHLEQG